MEKMRANVFRGANDICVEWAPAADHPDFFARWSAGGPNIHFSSGASQGGACTADD
jgi:hypothetical protein